MNQEVRATLLVKNFLASSGRRDADQKREAEHLAEAIRQQAIDLCMNRATEFSPRIGEFFALAAQLALIAFGARSDKVDAYKKDISKSEEHLRAFEEVRSKVLQ